MCLQELNKIMAKLFKYDRDHMVGDGMSFKMRWTKKLKEKNYENFITSINVEIHKWGKVLTKKINLNLTVKFKA